MRPSRSRSRRARPRRIGGWCLGAALLCALPSARLGAQSTTPDSTGQDGSAAGECCKPLLYPLGGRIVALGRAVVADTAPDAVLSNPAGLAGLHAAAFLVHYRKLVQDGQLLGLSYVMKPKRFGTFALSYTLADLGTVELTDSSENSTGQTYSQTHELALTFATALGAGVSSGVTYRLFVFRTPGSGGGETGGSVNGATQLIDLGLQYHPRRVRGLAFGAAVVNAGIPLQIVNYEQSDRPPVRERIGGTVELLHLLQRDSTLTGTFSAQLDVGGEDGVLPALGAQVTVGDVVSIRGGWHAGGKNPMFDSGVALGVGLKLQRFTVSIARAVVLGPLDSDSPFQVTFGMSF